MHPILARKRRLALYLAAWAPIGLGLAAMVVLTGDAGWAEALAVALPASLLYAFVCLAPWYLCRALPITTGGAARLLATWLAAAVVSSTIWLLLAGLMTSAFEAALPVRDLSLGRTGTVLFALGVLLFALSAALHYLVLAVERSREAETRGLALKVLAREAELKALRTQIDPHFLFNSLHSISALTTADPAGARRMCLLLGEFLRLSLKLGARDRIPLAEEMALVERFLGIEQVRFGDRLRASVTLDPGAAGCEVPALLLQPLVENAVRHGIAELVDGGLIDVRAERHGDRLTIRLKNPCDPERRSQSGAGVGLANVRGRLTTAFGTDARIAATERDGRFHVELSLPAIETDASDRPMPVPAAGLATEPSR